MGLIVSCFTFHITGSILGETAAANFDVYYTSLKKDKKVPSVTSLKQILRQKGLDTSGNQKELFKRLDSDSKHACVVFMFYCH
jgi:hypothetical protein